MKHKSHLFQRIKLKSFNKLFSLIPSLAKAVSHKMVVEPITYNCHCNCKKSKDSFIDIGPYDAVCNWKEPNKFFYFDEVQGNAIESKALKNSKKRHSRLFAKHSWSCDTDKIFTCHSYFFRRYFNYSYLYPKIRRLRISYVRNLFSNNTIICWSPLSLGLLFLGFSTNPYKLKFEIKNYIELIGQIFKLYLIDLLTVICQNETVLCVTNKIMSKAFDTGNPCIWIQYNNENITSAFNINQLSRLSEFKFLKQLVASSKMKHLYSNMLTPQKLFRDSLKIVKNTSFLLDLYNAKSLQEIFISYENITKMYEIIHNYEHGMFSRAYSLNYMWLCLNNKSIFY